MDALLIGIDQLSICISASLLLGSGVLISRASNKSGSVIWQVLINCVGGRMKDPNAGLTGNQGYVYTNLDKFEN